MAHQARFPAATIQAIMNTLGAMPDAGGKLRFYTGTQPAAGGGSIGASVLLAECVLALDAFAACTVGGTIVAGVIAPEDDVIASGTATWARLLTVTNVPICDLSVGTSSLFDVNLETNVFVIHGTVIIGSMSLNHPLL